MDKFTFINNITISKPFYAQVMCSKNHLRDVFIIMTENMCIYKIIEKIFIIFL